MIRIGRLPGQYGTASLLGFALGLVIFVVLSKGAIESPWPVAFRHYDQHLAGWIAIRVHSALPEFFPDIARRYAAYLAALPGGYRPWHLLWRFDIPLLLSSIAGLWITWAVGRGIPDTKITSGRRLFEGRSAQRELRERANEECAISGAGLKLHPSFDWCLSRDRETRHFNIYGSIGGGKTVAIKGLLEAAIARGDKIVLFDNKGDFTSEMSAPFVLVTPWDKRSHAWDIARDCTNKQDARELAARLVPESQDPMWSSAARQILSAIVQKLQNDKPSFWSWQDLYKTVCLPQEALATIVSTYTPEARATETEGKTVDGILINFSSYMGLVADLAAAWGDAPPERRFSFSQWIHDPAPVQRVVIMQGSGRYQELTRGYVQSIISLLSGRINSAEVGESRERRLWFFLDEFPQLGKLDGFSSILEVGRSKGICVVISSQSFLSQVSDAYNEHTASTWGSLIGTQIVTRVNSGDTAQWIAKEVIGYVNTEKTIIHNGEIQPPVTQPPQLVLEPSEIADYLGTTRRGIRAVLLGMGDAFILEWPFTHSPKLREASIESSWVTAGVKSNKPLPPLPPTGSPPMPPIPTAQPTTATPPTGLPKLKLRTPTADEVLEMASTGTDIRFSPEPLNEMKTGADIVSGGAA
jgi:hypothetical protein